MDEQKTEELLFLFIPRLLISIYVIREAAKKVLLLMAGPLRGGGGGGERAGD